MRPQFELCQSRCPTSWLKVGFIWFSSSLEVAVEEQLPLLSTEDSLGRGGDCVSSGADVKFPNC